MSQPAAITAAFLDKVLCLLAPLFLTSANNDLAAARDAVRSALACHNARTDDELRLAALVIAFGFGALDALSKAVDPDLSLNQVMRLRGSATALSRASHQHQAKLDKLHDQPEAAPETETAEPTLPDSVEPRDLLAFAQSVLKIHPAQLTRQQRRAAERALEKAQRHQDAQTRRLARA